MQSYKRLMGHVYRQHVISIISPRALFMPSIYLYACRHSVPDNKASKNGAGKWRIRWFQLIWVLLLTPDSGSKNSLNTSEYRPLGDRRSLCLGCRKGRKHVVIPFRENPYLNTSCSLTVRFLIMNFKNGFSAKVFGRSEMTYCTIKFSQPNARDVFRVGSQRLISSWTWHAVEAREMKPTLGNVRLFRTSCSNYRLVGRTSGKEIR